MSTDQSTTPTSVSTSEETLRRLLKSWRSRYRHIILLKSHSRRVIEFRTEWARKPTPHEPLPDTRVTVDFAFLFDTKYNDEGVKVALPPTITYRIESEALVHRDLTRNIDHHILRHLKFKTEFARRNPLPLTVDQAEYFASRAQYEPLDEVADTHLGSFVDFADQATADRHVEKELIDMFQRADGDQNGSLDPEEFEDLLINSKWGFTKDDVAIVMRQHDANDDGKLVYKEFIPIAIDLVQAQRASAYAQTMTTNATEAAYKSSLHRIQHSKDLHRCMDSGLGRLDPEGTGFVSTGGLVDLLRSMDLDLTDGEIGAILSKMKALARAANGDGGTAGGKGSSSSSKVVSGSATPSRVGGSAASVPITYKFLQDAYEDLLLDCLQSYQLEKDASDVELYLNSLLAKRDPANSGILSEKAIEDTLHSPEFASRIALSSTQIYAMIGEYGGKPKSTSSTAARHPEDDDYDGVPASSASSSVSSGGFKYRSFSRKAAFMIHQLFDSTSLSERTAMIKRSSITPIQLLSKSSRSRIEGQMRAKFVEFDSDNDGRLSAEEFRKCMADTHLILSVGEIEVLRQRAANPQTGDIDQAAWIKFSYETLLHLQRDAALKKQMTAVLQQESEKKEPAPPMANSDSPNSPAED